MAHESPYMRAAEAAAYLQFLRADGTPNVKAFYAWRYRHPRALRAYRAPGAVRGPLRFRRVDVENAFEREHAALDRFLEAKRGRVA